jgi:ribosome-binding ATPase YchF (GTP1/OBG family)
VVPVPDPRLDQLAGIAKPEKILPTTVEFVDIAGLVAGASQGEGLGNKFLAHIREVDAIAHVVRCFENPDVVHVSGKVNPIADIAGVAGGKSGAQALLDVAPFRNADALLHVVRMFRDPSVPHPAGSVDAARDVRTMEDEVILADLGVVERRLERLERDIKKTNTPELRKEQEILQRCREALEAGRPLRALELGTDDAKRLRGVQFLSAKPLLIVLNLDEADLANAQDAVKLAGIEDFLSGAATRAVPICAKIELEIAQLDEADRAAFMADLGL